jgi:hypothetical protein
LMSVQRCFFAFDRFFLNFRTIYAQTACYLFFS